MKSTALALAAIGALAVSPALAQQSPGAPANGATAFQESSPGGQFLDPSLVRDIQQTLRDRGYAVGQVDGVVGPNTRSALSSFQRDLGMTGTGSLDAQTLAALNLPAMTQQGQLPQGAGQGGTISDVPQEPGNISTPGVSRPLSSTDGQRQ